MPPSAKKLLLANLSNDVYARCGRGLHGVGVLAIRPIPKGVYPFSHATDSSDSIVRLTEAEVKALPRAVQRMVDDFCLFIGSHWHVPAKGFNNLDISYYMNHSKKPTVEIVIEAGEHAGFITKRKIRTGEELTIDYGAYAQCGHQSLTDEFAS
jgi:hypothetical protein